MQPITAFGISFRVFLSLLAVLSISPVPVQAQRPGNDTAQSKALPGTAGDNSPKGTARIIGYVLDSMSTKVIEFASIALYNRQTNQAVDGTVADEKGKFTLSKLMSGQYRVLVSFVGYRSKTIDHLTLIENQSLNLGDIPLGATVNTLAELTVRGEAPLIEEKVDRLVYNADKDITAKGGDATDILRKVPLLTVDLDGNVSLRGSSSIQVLINNKPSTILAGSVADAMKQIPADQIKTVEVITSPSARYDAQGSGGIINIITKKNSLQGLNLSLDSGVGNRVSILSLNGGYRKGKAGFTIGGAGRGVYNTITKTTLDQTSQVDERLTRTSQTGDGDSRGVFGQYNLGFDYDLSPNHSLMAGVRFGVRNVIRQLDLMTQSGTDDSLTAFGNRNVEIINLSKTVDVNVDYLRTFRRDFGRRDGGTLPAEWSISTLFSRNGLINNFGADLLNSSGTLTGRQKNQNNNVNQEFTIQTDYLAPIQWNPTGAGAVIELGGKVILREVRSQYRYLLAGPSGLFITENNHTFGALTYHQNIVAAYTSYTHTTKKRYTFKGGLRYEHTFIDARTQEAGPLNLANYGVLVPSLNVAKTIKGTTVKLGYNRRIQRPGLQQLNPNFNAANPQNIQIGNPKLRPELTTNVELNLSWTVRKGGVNVTFFARRTNNSIVQLRQPSDSLPGAIVTTYENIGKQRAYGTNLAANLTASARIRAGFFLNIFYTTLTGQVLQANGRAQMHTNQGMNFSGGSSLQAALKNGWAAQAFGSLQGRQVQLQGSQGGSVFYTMGLRKEFKDKKGSVGLSVENFAAKRFTVRTVLNSAQLNQHSQLHLYNRGARATFTYKIGRASPDKPRKKAKSVKNDDVKSEDNNQ